MTTSPGGGVFLKVSRGDHDFGPNRTTLTRRLRARKSVVRISTHELGARRRTVRAWVVALSPALKARFVLAGRLVALAVAVGLVAKGPHLVWLILPAKSTALVIVDKTVAHDDYRAHRGLTWILRALKVTRTDGTFYEMRRDYVGFDPGTRTGRDLSAADLASADALFITDTYGVYVADYKEPGDREALDRSRRLYGGMTASEAAVVDDFSARGGLVIAEFNTARDAEYTELLGTHRRRRRAEPRRSTQRVSPGLIV